MKKRLKTHALVIDGRRQRFASVEDAGEAYRAAKSRGQRVRWVVLNGVNR